MIIPRRGFAATVATANLKSREIEDETSKGKKKVMKSFDLPKKGSIGKGSGQGKNYVVDKEMFTQHSNGLVVKKKYIKDYERMLSENYVKALQMQLKNSTRANINGVRTRYSKIGYATGSLYKGIKARTKVTVEHNKKKGRYNILFKMKHDYSDIVGENGFAYGDSLTRNRPIKKGVMSWSVILTWMKAKKGNFKLIDRNAQTDAITKKAEEKSIAIAIATKLSREVHPPVAKDWSVWDKNAKLRKDFKMLTKREGINHRRKIRRNIMKNIINYS